MKYFAILRDSLREALDSKILYATLIVSIIVVLLVGSLTYRQVPAEEHFTRFTQTMNWVLEFAAEGRPAPRYEIVDFQQTNKAVEPWKGDYRFYFVIDFPTERDADEVRQKKYITTDQMKREFKQHFSWIDELEVTEVQTAKPTEFRYLMQTRGTNVPDRRGWRYEPRLFFGAVPMPIFQGSLGRIIEFITDDLIASFGAAVTMLLGTIVTAFFIPNMLRKGTIDLLLAKPIHRSTLLVYKFIGGLTFMFLNTLVIMVGIWLVLGMQAGLWVNGLLLCVFLFTFQFAIFYSVSTLMAVLTRSAIVAILVSIVTWGLLFVIGWGYRAVDQLRPEKLGKSPQDQAAVLPGWVYVTVDIIHFVTPHYKDIDVLTTKLIRSDLVDHSTKRWKDTEEAVGSINWFETILVTMLFMAAMLGLACWRFGVRDY